MRKRLIYRCDDVGYTPAYDLGIFEVLNSGIGCSADVMFDACDAAEALKKIEGYAMVICRMASSFMGKTSTRS